MKAGRSSCVCEGCGVVCKGMFDGCRSVWGRRGFPALVRVVDAPSTDDHAPGVSVVGYGTDDDDNDDDDDYGYDDESPGWLGRAVEELQAEVRTLRSAVADSRALAEAVEHLRRDALEARQAHDLAMADLQRAVNRIASKEVAGWPDRHQALESSRRLSESGDAWATDVLRGGGLTRPAPGRVAVDPRNP